MYQESHPLWLELRGRPSGWSYVVVVVSYVADLLVVSYVADLLVVSYVADLLVGATWPTLGLEPSGQTQFLLNKTSVNFLLSLFPLLSPPSFCLLSSCRLRVVLRATKKRIYLVVDQNKKINLVYTRLRNRPPPFKVK